MNIYDPPSENYLQRKLPGAKLRLRLIASVRYCGIEHEILADDPLSATHKLVRMILEEKEAERKAQAKAEAKEGRIEEVRRTG